MPVPTLQLDLQPARPLLHCPVHKKLWSQQQLFFTLNTLQHPLAYFVSAPLRSSEGGLHRGCVCPLQSKVAHISYEEHATLPQQAPGHVQHFPEILLIGEVLHSRVEDHDICRSWCNPVADIGSLLQELDMLPTLRLYLQLDLLKHSWREIGSYIVFTVPCQPQQQQPGSTANFYNTSGGESLDALASLLNLL